jgi:hypothetical protein
LTLQLLPAYELGVGGLHGNSGFGFGWFPMISYEKLIYIGFVVFRYCSFKQMVVAGDAVIEPISLRGDFA